MKIEKAKKVLKQDQDDHDSVDIVALYDAEQLGIEALNFKQAWQKGQYFPPDYLLPGETKE